MGIYGYPYMDIHIWIPIYGYSYMDIHPYMDIHIWISYMDIHIKHCFGTKHHFHRDKFMKIGPVKSEIHFLLTYMVKNRPRMVKMRSHIKKIETSKKAPPPKKKKKKKKTPPPKKKKKKKKK